MNYKITLLSVLLILSGFHQLPAQSISVNALFMNPGREVIQHRQKQMKREGYGGATGVKWFLYYDDPEEGRIQGVFGVNESVRFEAKKVGGSVRLYDRKTNEDGQYIYVPVVTAKTPPKCRNVVFVLSATTEKFVSKSIALSQDQVPPGYVRFYNMAGQDVALRLGDGASPIRINKNLNQSVMIPRGGKNHKVILAVDEEGEWKLATRRNISLYPDTSYVILFYKEGKSFKLRSMEI